MNKLIQQLAAMARYGIDCGDCGLPADVSNADCEDHKPYHPSDPDDAELTLNSFIDQARAVLRRIQQTVIVGSLEGIKIEVYSDRVMQYEMEFAGDPGGRWEWRETASITCPIQLLRGLAQGLNTVDRTAAWTAIAKAKEALDA